MPKMTHTLLVMFSSALLAASGFAAGFVPRLVEQLPGEWESFSFASTNFDLCAGGTNVILSVYKVEPLKGFVLQNVQGGQPQAAEAVVDAELRTRDATGREHIVPHSGEVLMTAGGIHFTGPGGFFWFEYSLTNDVLTLEKHFHGTYNGAGPSIDFKAQLKKVASKPGKAG
jgi:hypothetical protein